MFFWRKTWNNRLRNIFIVLLIFFPTLEVFIHIRQAIASGTAYYPDYCSFLSCNTVGVGHTLQSIYLWLLPLYMLFIFSNDCIWDFESGYVNLIQAKMGKKKYIIENLKIFLGCKWDYLHWPVIKSSDFSHSIFWRCWR